MKQPIDRSTDEPCDDGSGVLADGDHAQRRPLHRFELDVDAARTSFAAAVANGELILNVDSPGRVIESLFYEHCDHLVLRTSYDGWRLAVYTLIFDSYPDQILVVIYRPTPQPALAVGPWDCDELLSLSDSDRQLTVDEATSVVKTVLDSANDAITRADHRTGR